MDFQIKLFHWLDKGNHVIGIIRGLIDFRGFEQIFREVAEMTQPFLGCQVLIDLRDAWYSLEPSNIQVLVNDSWPDQWPLHNKIALVSPSGAEHHDQLLTLSACLSNRGVRVCVFYDVKGAIDWLADKA
ncbi:MAG: hypothetical protein ACREQK_01825 [Candidatus Binatia bacterium]